MDEYWKEIHSLITKDKIIAAERLYMKHNPNSDMQEVVYFIKGVSFGMTLERKSASWPTEKK